MTDLVTATGRIIAEMRYNTPLSIHFLDEDYRDRESEHISLGVGFWVGVICLLASGLTYWLKR